MRGALLESRSGAAVLAERIAAARIPPGAAGNLRLATWNIRELGKSPRLPESIAFIAQVIASFDFVSVVELRDDVTDLERILLALGPAWSVVFSDYRVDRGGNRERVGFVFDTRRVRFTGLASSAEGKRYVSGGDFIENVPWWRPPFLASFVAASTGHAFVTVAAHVRWGSTVGAREREVMALGRWLMRRAEERYFEDKDVIVAGDFNLAREGSDALQALAAMGLVQAPHLSGEQGTNLAGGKRYDRLLRLSRCKPPLRFSGQGGALDFYCGDHHTLFPHRRMSKDAFTWQLSDHLPLWAEVLHGHW